MCERKFYANLDSQIQMQKLHITLLEEMTQSNKALYKKSDLMEFLVTARFGENTVNTTAEHFIATFIEKFRLLDELTPTVSEQLPPNVRMMMLQTAVNAIDDLRHIKSVIEVHGDPNNYEAYLTLLTKAAVTYDRSKEKVNTARKIHLTNQYFSQNFPEDSEEDLIDTRGGEIDGGIDMGQQFLLANKARQYKSKSSLQDNKALVPRLPFIPRELWFKLDQKTQELLLD